MSSSLILRPSWQSALLAILSQFVLFPTWGHSAAPFPEFIDPNPNPGNQFGATVVALSTGNVVITSPFDDAGEEDAGAVYLFNGATGVLISTLTGSQANDNVGLGGVAGLSNGNYVVVSQLWDNADVIDAGAVTWGNGISGVKGVVSSSNSLVGTHQDDSVGSYGVVALNNGNYVVVSPGCDIAGIASAGAVTWGSGNSGVKGVVSSSNSLVGTKSYDQVGRPGVIALSNGNYVVSSSEWDNASLEDAGAVTWCNGTSGLKGAVTTNNSLFGSQKFDVVGNYGVVALSNGNYVVISQNWDNVDVVEAGAVTWGNGTTGIKGAVSSSNSLVGTTDYDHVGLPGVTALSNGNYVVASRLWNNANLFGNRAGAVTWGSGTTGISGVITSSNSLVGKSGGTAFSDGGDGIGTEVTALTNGNYVVSSPSWNNTDIDAGTFDAGAATWGSGTSGIVGVVSSSNSLVGTRRDDRISSGGVTALNNGNYVVSSPWWSNTRVLNNVTSPVSGAGAATWGSGSSGVIGAVSSANSLVGTKDNDFVGSVTALSNGNYVVVSSSWRFTSPFPVGAVTWGNGMSGVVGAVSNINSLVGTQDFDSVGSNGVVALKNGNYVVSSPNWDNATIADVGAVTWLDGTGAVHGAVSSSNSLVGTQASDAVGNKGITALSNGNYVVVSSEWDNAGVEDAGAVTWCSGGGLVSGVVSASNSLVGLASITNLQPIALDNVNNNYFGRFMDEGAGKVRLGSQTNGSSIAPTVPAVSTIFPSSGSILGGTSVTITGSGFTGVTGVTIGGTAATSVTVVNVNTITAITPAHMVGAVSVLVTTTAGTNSGNTLYTYLPPTPDIDVAQASPLTDGISTVPLNATLGGTSVPLTFTITNPGTANLTNLVVTKDGPGAADFMVSSLSSTGIPVGTGTATFTVTFSSNRIGVKTAALHIASNVPGTKNPFDISLTGNGRVSQTLAQTIAFETPSKLYLAEGPLTLSARASSGLPVGYTVISGPASLTGNLLTLTGTGTVKVRATQAGNADFLAATPVERTITVSANPTTLTLANLSQVYTGTPREITVLGATGTVDVTYKVGSSYVTGAPINVGSYPVKAVEVGGNPKTGTLVITKAPLFVQPDDQRKFAGQVNPVLGFSYSGFLGGDYAANSVSKAPTIATTATATSAGGLYPITASGGTLANYYFVYLKGTMKVETFAGSYEALLVDAGSQRPSAKLELTVAASSKAFTGKLTTATETAAVALNGMLAAPTLNETVTGSATVKKGTNTYLVTFTLPLTGDFTAETKLNGTTFGGPTNGRKLLTLATGQTLSYTGTHSALLAPATSGLGVPAGAGWAVATIDAKGMLKLAGKLADGTTLTASLAADVSSNPGYRLFLQPYTPARTGSFIAGAFALKPQFDPGLTGRRFVAFDDVADLTWVKAPRTQDGSYRAGFGPVSTRFTLDPWLPPVPSTNLALRLGLSGPAFQFTAKHSTLSSASAAELPTTLALNATTNAVSVIAPANTTKWKVTVTPATGAFVGSFELSDAGKKRTVPFSGIMRQPPVADTSGLIGDGNFQLPALPSATSNEVLSGEIGFER